MTDEAFVEFPKMARLRRTVIITEKIDGTFDKDDEPKGRPREIAV